MTSWFISSVTKTFRRITGKRYLKITRKFDKRNHIKTLGSSFVSLKTNPSNISLETITTWAEDGETLDNLINEQLEINRK